MIIDYCAAPTGGNILSGGGCDYGGLEAIFYTFWDDVDWAGSTWSGNQLTVLTMNTGKQWWEITFDPETANYNNSLQNESFYKNDIIFDVVGKNVANMVQIEHLRGACGQLVVVAFGRDCVGRVYGVTRNRANTAFQKTYRPIKVSAHEDKTDQSSGRSMDSVTLTCYGTHAPIYTSLGISGMVTLLTPAA